ncbi:MAG: hypothetical protein AAB131_14615, partial [Actinomycetota bacterium]
MRSAEIKVAEQRSGGATFGLAVCLAAALATGAALVVAGRDTTAGLVVVSLLAVAWAGAGAVTTIRQHCPAASIVNTFAAATAAGATSWSLDAANDLHGSGGLLVDAGQRLAVTLTAALMFHLLMTMPDGHLARASHRRFVWAGYVIGATMGLTLLVDRDRVLVWPVVLLWAAALLALPTAHANYRAAGLIDQRRMQWLGWAAVVAAEMTLVSVGLSLVADWPHHNGEVALAASGLVPLAIAASTVPRLLARVDRLLTHTVALTGLTALIVVAYLLALAAFGELPLKSMNQLCGMLSPAYRV